MQHSLKSINSLLGLAVIIGSVLSACGGEEKSDLSTKPNVIVIYTDDVGYGDIGVYGGMIPTPHIDRLAKEGLLMENAYATAATCTPSRYSMLTGEYAWRAQGRGVAPGDASALIREGRETWPAIMQRAGYRTAVVGKWHLGLGGDAGPEWNGEISHGPLDIGFDYAFILPSTGDRVPTVYVEDRHVLNLDPQDPIEVNYRQKVGDRPTGLDHPELLKMMWSHGHNQTIINGISRIGYMAGGESALWRDEDFADVFVDKSVRFMTDAGDSPFFLFLATHDIHVPRMPHERFHGKSGYGYRGDALLQLDWTVGEVLSFLDEKALAENTIVIFTSDNGPVLDDGYEDMAEELIGDHKPWANLRGGKYSTYEAGTKVPMVVRWPKGIRSGTVRSALFSQVDMMGSFAGFLNEPYDRNQAEDTTDSWEALVGRDTEGRNGLVQEAIQGVLSYVSRDGYKFIPAHQGPELVPWGTGISTGFLPEDQLFYLLDDPGEKVSIAAAQPDKLKELKSLLDAVRKPIEKK
ncbi:MAG: sulfatase-like hydrolase/transferase [Lunatimonas sp.]|uniref:sulfatase-like hydrolase/transferase n=1 Tax=Lunatimonas sp. TaxID=2060141 RepID=UPI00263BDFDE|nr:sulfatase-like hydrolase/transferase [Lunatimonas sp.]MCC5938957.1 sulfatase-like hydrolase/transferase [Lunatimonas sp.]